MTNPLVTTVATEVAGEFDSKLSLILAPRRGLAPAARARAIAMYVYGRVAPGRNSFTAIGEAFGRDRTTVRHAYERVEGFMEAEAGFSDRLDEVIGRVRARA